MTTTSKEDGDPDGPFHVGIISELKDGKLFRVSSPYLLDSNVDGMVSGGNYYARLSGSRMIYTVSRDTVSSLLSIDVDDLRPSTLLDVSLERT